MSELSYQDIAEAFPLITDPSCREPLIVVNHNISLMPSVVTRIEVGIADRFEVDNMNTGEEAVPHFTFAYGSTWEKIDFEYRKSCSTQPRDFFAKIEFVDEKAVVNYTLALAAMGRNHRAVVLGAEYTLKTVRVKGGKEIRKLGRSAGKGARLSHNEYHEEQSPGGDNSHNFSSSKVMNSALRSGRLSGS